MPKVLCPQSPMVSQFGAMVSLVAAFLAVTVPSSAQSSLPSTTCDSAVSNMDIHFPSPMPREDGTKAFRYGANGPFVSGAGSTMTFSLALTFTPSEDAIIKLSGLDENCGGTSSSGTVFTFTFAELAQTNSISLDFGEGEVGLNGKMQKATLGAPRYLFLDVWDGDIPAQHAAYSYVIDLQNPRNPAQQ